MVCKIYIYIVIFLPISYKKKPNETFSQWNRTYIIFKAIKILNQLLYVYRRKYNLYYQNNKDSNCEIIVTKKVSINLFPSDGFNEY